MNTLKGLDTYAEGTPNINLLKSSNNATIEKSVLGSFERIKRKLAKSHNEKILGSMPAKEVDVDEYNKIFKSTNITNIANITDRDVVRWKGNITKIEENEFWADLEDLDDKSSYEIGRFKVEDVPNEDKDLFALGSIFYLSIGHITNAKGQVKKEKIFRFQRLSNWSEEEYDKSVDRAQRLYETITWD